VVHVENAVGQFVTSTTTDSDGHYLTQGLAAGTYFARTFNAAPYVNGAYPNTPCFNCQAFQASAPIVVAAAMMTSAIDIGLSRGGLVAGRITDAATGSGLSAVTVQVQDLNRGNITTALTAADGRYTLSDALPTGQYFVRTQTRNNYLDAVYGVVSCINCNVGGTPVAVTAGQTTAIDFALILGGRIAGHITDAITGGAAATAQIQVVDSNNGFITGAGIGGTGIFTTVALPAGTYFVRTLSAAGYFNQVFSGLPCALCNAAATGTPVIVTAGQLRDGVDFSLTPGGGTISGRVTAANTGQPVSNVDINIFNAAGVQVSHAFTRSGTQAGTYTSEDGLPAGTYYARASGGLYLQQLFRGFDCAFCDVKTGTPIVVNAGANTPSIDFALNLGGRISGRAFNVATGAGIPNVSVNVVDASGQFMAGGQTDGNGNYTTFQGLPAGSYFVRTFNALPFVNQAYSNVTCVSCQPQQVGAPVTVVAGATTPGINFPLVRGGRIAGRVTDVATGATLPNIYIRVLDLDRNFVADATTDSGGFYQISEALPAGSYFLRASTDNYYMSAWTGVPFCVECSSATPTPVTLVSGQFIAVNFALTLGGEIAGRLTDTATGDPAAMALVEILDAAGTHVAAAGFSPDGLYTTDPLPAGTYFARSLNVDGHSNQLFDGKPCMACTPAGGTPIVVTAGATTNNVDFALAPGGGTIAGRVTKAADGAALQEVYVDIFNAAGARVSWGISVFGDDGSTFISFDGLPSGTYYARTTGTTDYVPQLFRGIDCVGCLVTGGTPIAVTAPAQTSGVDFALNAAGHITGRVFDAASGIGVSGITVNIANAQGLTIGSVVTDASGAYSVGGLKSGTYFEWTSNGGAYVDTLYGGQPCVNGCNVLSGAPIGVTAGLTTSGIDIPVGTGGGVDDPVIEPAPLDALQLTDAVIMVAPGETRRHALFPLPH